MLYISRYVANNTEQFTLEFAIIFFHNNSLTLTIKSLFLRRMPRHEQLSCFKYQICQELLMQQDTTIDEKLHKLINIKKILLKM